MHKALFVAIGLVAGLALASFPARAVSGPDPLTTTRLTIVDDSGKTRMIVGMASGCPTVTFFTSDDKRSMQLYVRDDKPEFITIHEDGQQNRTRIFIDKDGSIHSVLMDDKGVSRMDITVDKSGEPHIDFADKTGKVLRRLPK